MENILGPMFLSYCELLKYLSKITILSISRFEHYITFSYLVKQVKSNKMCEIPENILEILKCSQCDGYLSSTPIKIKTNGENLCGNCATADCAENLTTRNIVYEKLALLALFPCRYKTQGCDKKLVIDEIKKHESACEYHPFDCPMVILQNCTWLGKPSDLKLHYEENHSNFIVEHPANLSPNINNNNEVCLLMEVFNLLFLVQVKCHVAAAKLWYCVRFIGNPKYASLFEFTLDIGNSNERLVKKKDIQSGERLLLSKNDVLEININALLAIIDDTDVKNISSTINVNLKNKNCLTCKKDTQTNKIYLEETGYRCVMCYNDTMKAKCKYFLNGCTYEDLQMNMSKHEMWFCNFSKSICTLNNCSIEMPENVTLIEHMTSKHIKSVMNYYPAVSGYLKQNVFYGDIIELYGAKFISSSKFTNSKFKYKIISNLTKEGTMLFKCKVKIINPNNHQYIEKELIRDLKSTTYDWIVVIEDTNNITLHETIDNGVKVKIFQCQIIIEKCNRLSIPNL